MCGARSIAAAWFVAAMLATTWHVATSHGLAQQPAKAPKAKKTNGSPAVATIESRTWNSRGQGGLIEGSCKGVDGDQIKIVVGNIERSIPYELFHREDLATIRAHFGLKDEFPEQATTDPAPRAECQMLHTMRGGVFPEAKVVGHDGNLVFLAGPDGLKYRVPFGLFAEGVRGSVRDAITRLDGKPFTPIEDKPAPNKKPPSPSGATTKSKPPSAPAKKPEPPNVAPTARPQPGQVVTPPLPMPKPSPPSVPTPMPVPTPTKSVADLKPLGDERVWTMRGGKLTWKGRLLELSSSTLRILTADGQTRQIPWELLEERDRQYAEALIRDGKAGEIPAGTRKIEAQDAEFVSIAEGKAAFVRDGRKMVPLDSQGKPMSRVAELAADYRLFRLQGAHWVAATDKEIHLLDRATLTSQKKIELWKYKRINDLAPHPTRPVCVVSVEHVSDHVRKNPAEKQRIVIVDLESGKIHEPDEAYGTWLRMHPSGNYLFAGFHAAFEAGPDKEFDATGRLVPRINVEHIDVLNRFRLDRFQLPLDEQFENAGTNGQGLAMTSDGGRVCYLSFTGYPTYSYQINALQATDFQQKPVTLSTKDRCDCKRIVFNTAGTLAASPTRGGAVVFDATTGKELDGALAESPELAGAAIHDLAFTRDDRRLVFLASRGGSSLYLHAVELRIPTAK